MKTLIVYEKNSGNVSFTQSIGDVEDVEYDSIIADIPDNRVVARVEDGEVILEDTKEVKEAKESLMNLYNNMTKKPKFMCVIVGFTDVIAKDPETGIYIVPITALKP